MSAREPVDAWALFDGPVEVRTVLLDFAESPVLAQLTAELVAAIETHEYATGLARLTLAARIRTLTARIERRMNLQPVKLQNRDRSTAASIAQVQSIAKNPDPDLLGYNKTPTEGAPIVFADYDEMSIPAALLGRKATVTFTKDMTKAPVQFAVVPAGDVMVSHDFNGMPVAGYDALEAPAGKLRAVAGNGRAAGIQLAFEKGTATNYVAGLIEEADMLQLDANAIAALARPMLVRIMRHGDVTADIGDKTNSSGMAGFSAVEQAKTDADRIDFANLSFNDDGTPTLDALTRFVQAMPIAEQAALAPDGSPTNQALDRLMAATFNRAYQNDDLVKLYSQSLDPEIKNVLFGMAQAAGDMAALQGKGEYDIRSFVTDAATMASNAKRSGLPLSRIAEQRDMGMADESNDIAALFARNARSAKRIADALRSLARAALAQADAEDEDMFGPVAKVPPADLVREATGAELLDSVSLLDSADDDLRVKLSALQSLGAGSALERIRIAQEIAVLIATMTAERVGPAPTTGFPGETSATTPAKIAPDPRVKQEGQRVTLTSVKRAEYIGRSGHVAGYTKSRNLVKVRLDNGQTYDAEPANLSVNEDGVVGPGLQQIVQDGAKRKLSADRRAIKLEAERIEAEKAARAQAKVADRVSSVMPGVPEAEYEKILKAVQRARRGSPGTHVVVSWYGPPMKHIAEIGFKSLDAADRYAEQKRAGDKGFKGVHGIFSPLKLASEVRAMTKALATGLPINGTNVAMPLTESKFYSKYWQHIDLRGNPESVNSVIRDGWKPGIGPNVTLPYRGGEPTTIMQRKFMPKAGQTVYLVPKEWVQETPNGGKIKAGWKPESHEVITVAEDGQAMYAAYINALKSS